MRPNKANLAKLRSLTPTLRELRSAAGSAEELGRWIDVVLDTKTDDEALVAYDARAEWAAVLAENKARNEAIRAQEAEFEARLRQARFSSRGKGRPWGQDRFWKTDVRLLLLAEDRFRVAQPKQTVTAVLGEIVNEEWERKLPAERSVLGASPRAIVHRLLARLRSPEVRLFEELSRHIRRPNMRRPRVRKNRDTAPF
jgi:hypothetical protein